MGTENHSLFNNRETIAATTRGKDAIAVSDGSFGEETGTSAFVLEGENSTGQIVGVNVVPGYPEDQSSLRSKLPGIYGIVISISETCQEHRILKRGN